MRHRIETVDYLRGLFALSILAYHYYTWGGLYAGPLGDSVLTRLGIYGVSAFYVISGISFGYVYRDLRIGAGDFASFYVKRLFRLAPLYSLAVAGMLGFALLSRMRGGVEALPSPTTVLLNLTLAFGVLAPGAYLPVGGWSIGNEVAFYLAFPLAVAALRGGPVRFALVLAASVGAALYFAFGVLTPARPLTAQWDAYINPLNQGFLFVAGVGVSAGIGRVALSPRISYAMLALFAAAFALLPSGRDQSSIVAGLPRLLFSAICIGICTVGAVGRLPLPRLLDRALSVLGAMSYSVYLLHPLVYRGASAVLTRLGAAQLVVACAVALTLAAAWLVYRMIEAPMIRVGKRVAVRCRAAVERRTGHSAEDAHPAALGGGSAGDATGRRDWRKERAPVSSTLGGAGTRAALSPDTEPRTQGSVGHPM